MGLSTHFLCDKKGLNISQDGTHFGEMDFSAVLAHSVEIYPYCVIYSSVL